MDTHPSFYEEEFKGNWMKFSSFAWSRHYELDDAEDFGIFYTHHRDSGLLDLANAEVMDTIFNPMVDNELVFSEDHNHWAVGWIKGYAIKVHTPDGDYTPAFLEYCKIKNSLDDYPVLDDEVFSRLEYECSINNILQCYQEEVVWRGEYEEVNLPESWADDCFTWLWNEYPEDLESPDDSWPDYNHIIEFMVQNDYIKKVEEE